MNELPLTIQIPYLITITVIQMLIIYPTMVFLARPLSCWLTYFQNHLSYSQDYNINLVGVPASSNYSLDQNPLIPSSVSR